MMWMCKYILCRDHKPKAKLEQFRKALLCKKMRENKDIKQLISGWKMSNPLRNLVSEVKSTILLNNNKK